MNFENSQNKDSWEIELNKMMKSVMEDTNVDAATFDRKVNKAKMEFERFEMDSKAEIEVVLMTPSKETSKIRENKLISKSIEGLSNSLQELMLYLKDMPNGNVNVPVPQAVLRMEAEERELEMEKKRIKAAVEEAKWKQDFADLAKIKAPRDRTPSEVNDDKDYVVRHNDFYFKPLKSKQGTVSTIIFTSDNSGSLSDSSDNLASVSERNEILITSAVEEQENSNSKNDLSSITDELLFTEVVEVIEGQWTIGATDPTVHAIEHQQTKSVFKSSKLNLKAKLSKLTNFFKSKAATENQSPFISNPYNLYKNHTRFDSNDSDSSYVDSIEMEMTLFVKVKNWMKIRVGGRN